MANRRDADRWNSPLTEEDDWFHTPFEDPVETDEIPWQDDEPVAPPPRRRRPSELAQRQAAVLLAVLAVIALIVVPIVLIRALTGSDGTVSPLPTQPVVTTPSTTPAGTTPASTTPSSTTPTGTTTVPTDTVLRPGASGTSVEQLQQALTELGYDPGTVDGKYGTATTNAVIEFQTAEGLPQDGAAGPETLTAINAALAGT